MEFTSPAPSPIGSPVPEVEPNEQEETKTSILKKIIEAYKSMPELWNITLKDYSDLNKKRQGYETLLQIFVHKATMEDVNCKLKDLQLPAAPRVRRSLLVGFDPLYLSKAVEENSPEEQSLFSVIPSQDLLVGDQSDVTLTGGNVSQCSHPEIAKGDDNQEPPVEKVPADIDNITKVAKELTMADVTDKLAVEKEENAELKLQLNASQQVPASLELQEQVIIKSQTEALRKDQAFKLEIKQLKEKCLENEARELNHRKMMDEYEKTIAAQLSELKNLEEEINKSRAMIRRLEITNASLTYSLDQKTKECSALAALCDEVTGKV